MGIAFDKHYPASVTQEHFMASKLLAGLRHLCTLRLYQNRQGSNRPRPIAETNYMQRPTTAIDSVVEAVAAVCAGVPVVAAALFEPNLDKGQDKSSRRN